MSIAANLFHTSDPERETLHQRISPSEEQRQEQAERWNELAEYLRDYLKEKTGFNVKTWIQGSYKFGTQIRPARKGEEFDIDLGIYFEWPGNPEERMQAKTLKHYVRDAVKAFATDAQEVKGVIVPPKERCERVSYERDFHIDVPGYHLSSDQDNRTLATETKGWEHSDPKALVVWFREEAGDDNDRTQLRRIVRYLKMWAALKFKPEDRPSSIMLTVLATNAFRGMSKNVCDDDDVLGSVIKSILDCLNEDRKVPNPTDREEDLNRLNQAQNNNLIASLEDLNEIAERALAAGTKLEASVLWSEAFEHFFPVPQEDELLEQATMSNSTALVAIRPLEIEVLATPRNGAGRTYRGINTIGPIPKNYDIRFRVSSELPLMANVEWMVRNSGAEADQVNDLGHRIASGATAEERSAYNGSHYMDCLARQYGRIIGYRRVPVQINDGVVRNPPRPNYVKFRARSR